MAAVAFAFTSSLMPSESAKSNADFRVKLSDIKEGKVLLINHPSAPLLILRPNPEQLAAIKALDPHVNAKESNTFYEPVKAFVYWGIDTRFGCGLDHIPPGPSLLSKYSAEAKWLGGYWSVGCEVSYDYSGRVITSYEYTNNGFVGDYKNLQVPHLHVDGDSLVVLPR